MSVRSDRMLQTVPSYYHYSSLYKAVQQAIADDLDSNQVVIDDLGLQLYITTATWGLVYWEKTLGIATVTADGYEIRRSRVLAAWRGIGNFGVDLIKTVCSSFINGDVEIRIRIPEHEILITFVGNRGIPPNLDDLKAQIDNIVHAHLGVVYKFTYLVWEELDAQYFTWRVFEGMGFTWENLEIWVPPTR